MRNKKPPDCTQCHEYIRIDGKHACTDVSIKDLKDPSFKYLDSQTPCPHFWKVRRQSNGSINPEDQKAQDGTMSRMQGQEMHKPHYQDGAVLGQEVIMNRYSVTIKGLSFFYELGYYYAEDEDDARRQAWSKHRSTFRDCSINMLVAIGSQLGQ